MKKFCRSALMLAIIASFLGVNNVSASGTTIDQLRYENSQLYILQDGDDFNSWYTMDSFDVLVDISTNDNQSSVSTTYDMAGYGASLKVDSQEAWVNFGTSTTLDGVNLDISLEQVSSRKVVATYTVKNNALVTKNVSVGAFADIDINDDSGNLDNDQAAIVRKNNHKGFIVTQDSAEEDIDSYGLSYSIDLSPAGTTTWIGNYFDYSTMIFYSENRYTNGTVDSLTHSDQVDTALTYSWTYALEPGESKSYTATFTVEMADIFNVDFYAISDFDTVYTTKTAVLNGALTMPAATMSAEAGYNYKWNSKRDGSGFAVDAGDTMIYDGTTAFYEYKYHNEVVMPREDDDLDDYGTLIELDEESLAELSENANQSYGDVVIKPTVLFDMSSDTLADDDFNTDEIVENGTPAGIMDFTLKKTTTNQFGVKNEVDLVTPVQISLVLPVELTEKYNVFSVMAIDGAGQTPAVLIDSEYDSETGRITFKGTPGETYLFAGIYIAVPNTAIVPSLSSEKMLNILSFDVAGSVLIGYYLFVIRRRSY